MKIKLLILITAIVFVTNTLSAQLSKTFYIDKPGTLKSYLTQEEATHVTHLTLTGKINAIDFRHLRDEFPNLETLDISNADIRMYTGKSGTYPDKIYVYPPNYIPAYAFCRVENGIEHGKESLRKIVLSEKTKNIEDAAFKGCINLKICQIRRKTPPNLLPDALADSLTAIFIPSGSRDGYKVKKRWENFAFIEGDPIELSLEVGALSSLEDEILRSGNQPGNINFLTIEGKLDENDFKLIRNYMHNLVSLDISKTNATLIPEFTFAQKRYLLDIVLPENLETIEQRAFSGCNRLSGTILLPETLNSIEYGAFSGCDNLKKIIATGNKLTVIGEHIFGEENSRLIYQK